MRMGQDKIAEKLTDKCKAAKLLPLTTGVRLRAPDGIPGNAPVRGRGGEAPKSHRVSTIPATI